MIVFCILFQLSWNEKNKKSKKLFLQSDYIFTCILCYAIVFNFLEDESRIITETLEAWLKSI